MSEEERIARLEVVVAKMQSNAELYQAEIERLTKLLDSQMIGDGKLVFRLAEAMGLIRELANALERFRRFLNSMTTNADLSAEMLYLIERAVKFYKE